MAAGKFFLAGAVDAHPVRLAMNMAKKPSVRKYLEDIISDVNIKVIQTVGEV